MGLVSEKPLINGAGTSEAEWQNSLEMHMLPIVKLEEIASRGSRVFIISPHPDDEILGCGGLISMLSNSGYDISLIAMTNGEASHPGSEKWTSVELSSIRAEETLKSLDYLIDGSIRILRANFPDGSLSAQLNLVVNYLNLHIYPGSTVISTWSMDGHPDHEAVGKACIEVSMLKGANLIEMPIWAWHWAQPGEKSMPWHRAVKVMLPERVLASKIKALACFKSQLEADLSTGKGPILSAHILERFIRPFETFFISTNHA